jgi:hypothetical protein
MLVGKPVRSPLFSDFSFPQDAHGNLLLLSRNIKSDQQTPLIPLAAALYSFYGRICVQGSLDDAAVVSLYEEKQGLRKTVYLQSKFLVPLSQLSFSREGRDLFCSRIDLRRWAEKIRPYGLCC